MAYILYVPPVGMLARVVDVLMVPIMYLVSGTIFERPQRTHAWHIQQLRLNEKTRLDQKIMVHCNGFNTRHKWDVLFHIPIFGGWRHYVVLHTIDYSLRWHIGWSSPNQTAISRLVLKRGEPVRMLLGPGDVSFFATTESGYQLPLVVIGEGRLGDKGPHSKVTLL